MSRLIALNLLTAAAYLVTGWVSLQVVLPPDYVSIVFVAAGVAVGAVLTGGYRLLPGVWLGALGVQCLALYRVGSDFLTLPPLAIPLGATLQTWVTVALVRRLVGYPSAMDQPRHALRLLFVCLPVGCIIGASVGAPTLAYAGIISWYDLTSNWLTWWLGDTLGAVLFTPLMLVILGQPALSWRPRFKTVVLPVLLALGVVCLVLWQLVTLQERNIKEQFEKTAQDLALRLQHRLAAQTDTLLSVAKLVELAPHLTEQDFVNATQPWLDRYPGTAQFGWSPAIAHAQRAPYESGHWHRDTPGLRILSAREQGQNAPDAPLYLPLTWSSPPGSPPLGLDLHTLPGNESTVHAAIQTGQPQVTQWMAWPPEATATPSVVLFQAVFDHSASSPKLLGVLSTVLRIQDTLRDALNDPNPEYVTLCLHETDTPEQATPPWSEDAHCRPSSKATPIMERWQQSIPIAFAQRQWELQVRSGPLFWYWASGNSSPMWVFAGTALLTVSILSAFLIVMTGQGRRTAMLVEERTHELALSNARLMQLAHFDPLTGLSNRTFWMEQAENTLAAARLNHKEVGVLFLDLDRFKHINDSLGHTQGDLLLKTVADRLHVNLRTRDVLSRWGGDEFVILLPWIKGHAGGAVVAEKVARVLSEPIELDNQSIIVSASVGLALYPHDGDSVDTLLRHADTAMYNAKSHGRNGWRFFSSDMQEHVTQRLRIESGLRAALIEDIGALTLAYQPQIHASSGQVVGLEALLRWCDPELGTVSPAEFIPVAEECGLIEDLGNWVLRTACQQLRHWQSGPDAELLGHLRVSVNVSPLEFRRPQFVNHLQKALSDSRIPAQLLELEITESLLLQAGQDLLERLHTITELGVTLALDDFGTGYSSLGYLKRLPLSRLKIDQSFVRDIPGDVEDEAIIRATLSMAHDLGLDVVAEGVETTAQRHFLHRHHCDVLQGWLFSQALPPAQLAQWMRQRTQHA